MITYLIKSGLCLAFLLGVYLLFLEREKMHRFNRFFLLIALVFGLTVPFFTIDLGLEKTFTDFQWTEIESTPVSPAAPETSTLDTSAQPKEWPIKEAGLIFYTIITTVLFIRFVRNLSGLILNIRRSPKAYYYGSKLVLCKENEIPYSFMGYIFLQEARFKRGAIEDEIIEHERVHVNQKHSLDILFAELLKIVFWFNPVFYFYKKAIQLNHEFIADEIVTQQTRDISAYQKILLQHSSPRLSLELASSFNYSLTKKRFIMMKKKTSLTSKLIKQLLLIPVFALSVVAFSQHVSAQESTYFKLSSTSHVVDYLYILPHSEKENHALIQFKLNEKTEVELVVHESKNESSTYTILDKPLEKGVHEIPFDYSTLTEENIDFKFDFKREITITMSGSFLVDGKLKPIKNNPEEKLAVKKVRFERAFEQYMSTLERFKEQKDHNTKVLLELNDSVLRKTREQFTDEEWDSLNYPPMPQSVEAMVKAYGKIPIPAPVPNYDDAIEERKKILDMAHETWEQKWNAYRNIEPIEANLKKLKAAYFIALQSNKMLDEVQHQYYSAINEKAPPLPPFLPGPEKRIENN